MALKSSHAFLLKQRKKENYESIFPNLENALEQIKARLMAHSAQWEKLNYRLNDNQQKTRRSLQSLWVKKSKDARVQDITKFVYKL